jgi:uncharacterized membrane protein (TIGR02234 family)
MPEPRATFGRVVGLGLASGAIAAVAASKPWVVPSSAEGDPLGLLAEAGKMPLAGALSLVVLVCWGVLLVTRGRVRRVVAVLALLGAVALGITVVVGWVTLDEQVTHELAATAVAGPDIEVHHTAWFWAAAVGTLLSVAATAAAVRFAPAWPEMGRRYDAPGATRRSATPAEDPSSLDLWKSIDEGRDPTVGPG